MMTGIPIENRFTPSFFRKIGLVILFLVLLIGCMNSIVCAYDLGMIEPAVLEQNQTRWVILDARPRSEWIKAHIPGAFSFSWEDYTRTDTQGIPYRTYTPDELRLSLGKMGIDENTHLVVYGDADKSWGGEGWTCWVLSWLGHKGPIRLLTGGIQKWNEKGFSVSHGDDTPICAIKKYTPEINDDVYVSTSFLEQHNTEFSIVDTRSFLEWVRGYIPGAIRIDWTDFYTGQNKQPISRYELSELLEKKGVDMKKPIVYYCSGGIRSAYAWMVHTLGGYQYAKNYEGGIEAWEKRDYLKDHAAKRLH